MTQLDRTTPDFTAGRCVWIGIWWLGTALLLIVIGLLCPHNFDQLGRAFWDRFFQVIRPRTLLHLPLLTGPTLLLLLAMMVWYGVSQRFLPWSLWVFFATVMLNIFPLGDHNLSPLNVFVAFSGAAILITDCWSRSRFAHGAVYGSLATVCVALYGLTAIGVTAWSAV